MSEHYDFHYQPTGSGAISGQQVLQQTEDAINELGDYVYNNVGGAMDVAQQALETAQNAETNAQTALDTANSFSSAIQSAQQDASTALSTAQTAQTTASNANNTAIQAQQDANTAVTTANNASGQVTTLSGTVTTLGQRVTTAEGNIGQNTSDITALTTRVGTAEGNITTLQNDVTIAQGNASSAMATAGQVKQQAFVFRYSSTALTPSSTNSNTLLDNTDNLKVGDKVIDSNGVLFSVTAIDTANSTFTIGTALIDLAQDSDVVHKSGNETKNGELTVTKLISNSIQSATGNIQIQSSGTNRSIAVFNGSSAGDGGGFWAYGKDSSNGSDCRLQIYNTTKSRYERVDLVNSQWLPTPSGEIDCGGTANKWKTFNGLNPSSLGMPDLDNGVDISSYITIGDTDNNYTPSVNGWIWIRLIGNGASIIQGDFGVNANYVTDNLTQEKWVETNLFVTKDIQATIRCRNITGIVGAKFYPCLGNV